MAGHRTQRRMAAILAADVAGYSQLMGKDEESTLAVLKDYREVTDSLIANHGGRVFGSAGDSVIAEFASPVEAVRCATDIQLEIDKRNGRLPEENRLRFRIGINLGDVVVDGDNLMGDGVNVAARLEALSQPGGICISEAIYTQVRDRLSLDFLDLGELKVKNIARPVHAYRVPLTSEEQIKSPFRGLDVFEFENASLFFGRARAISTCIERLEQLASGGKAFLLIYGMSGSGKSSLLRAGLLPSIVRPGAVAGITLWRRCLIRPSEGSDTVTSLGAALLRDGALPELAQDKAETDFVNLLRGNPERAPALIRQALGKAAATAGVTASQARLILAIDQIEELFATEAEPASREAFVRLLAVLAGSGFVWIIGTIRADFFHRCSEIAGFSALKDGLSNYELLPPTGAEIAQIIREPARATGLRFEETTDQGRLDDVLQRAAAADPGSLPLLQFVLDALYEAGRERRLLTFAAYWALGGLEGAIARRADEVVDALPAGIQDALPAVLRALTTIRPGDEAITIRPASLTEIAGTPARSALIHALVTARLLVSDEDVSGSAVVRVAHEALLSRWPRARDIINADRSFLETRARLQTEARRWLSDKRNPELLLPVGKRLAEGEDLLSSRREEVDDQIVEYIKASSFAQREREEKDRQAERKLIEAAEAAKRERLEREAERLEAEAERRKLAAAAATRLARRTRYAAGIAIVLAAIAGVGAIVGFKGQREAERQAVLSENSAIQAKAAGEQAKAAEEKAVEARDQALHSQSLALSFMSQQTAAAGDTEAAVLLALEALPKNMAVPDRPYLPEAEAALYGALFAHRQIMVFHHDAAVTYARFNPRGDRIVTSSFDNTARIWDVRSGSGVAVLKGHQGAVVRAAFSADGSRVLSAARDNTARVWNAATGEQLFVFPLVGDYQSAIFSPDGSRVLTAGSQGAAIWDAQTGNRVGFVQGACSSLAGFSPDGRTFAANHGIFVGIWNAENGQPINRWNVRSIPDEVAFSPDGNRLLFTSWGARTWSQSSRLWDVVNGREIALLGGHRSDINSGTFSHNGQIIATVSLDGTARLWDGVTGQLRAVLGDETPGFTIDNFNMITWEQHAKSGFSSNDQLLATASVDGSVRIWDVERASLLTTINSHRDLVEHVEFSPTDNSLLTASRDGTARLWDVDGILTTALPHKYAPTFAVFSPDGVHLLTGGGESITHLWEVSTGREIGALNTRVVAQSATFSPDGKLVATASLEGKILIWDVASRREIKELKSEAGVIHIQFSPDGRLLE
jgi:WD40 repeat protein/class 3 adenylate cyclase